MAQAHVRFEESKTENLTNLTCEECNEPCEDKNNCIPCIKKHFQNDFDKWTSGNEEIDKLIKDAQLNSTIIEWIPHEKIHDIELIDQSETSKIHSAIWLDGSIKKWNVKDQKFDRNGNVMICLKSLDNPKNTINEIFNEMLTQIKCKKYSPNIINVYGLTKMPQFQSESYTIVMEYAKRGNLRKFLKNNFESFSLGGKIKVARDIANGLAAIHECGFSHKDLESGNILLLKDPYSACITGFSLANSNSTSIQDDSLKNIPYIAPEVLRGKNYTKSSDIYSFAIILSDIFNGIKQPLESQEDSDDSDRVIRITKGERPTIGAEVPDYISAIMKKCWDSDPSKRPNSQELKNYFNDIWQDYEKQNTQSAPTTGLDDPDSRYRSKLIPIISKEELARYREKQAMSKPGSHIMPNPVMSKPSHLDDDSRYRSKLIPMITEEDMARYRAKKSVEEQARKQMQDDDSRYRSKLIPMITEEDMARYRAKQAAQNQSSTSKHSEVEDESKYRSKLIPHITEEDIARHNAKKAAEEKARKQMQDDDPRYRSQLIPMITDEDIERHRAKKAAEEQARKQMQDDDRYRSRLIPMITEEDMARHRAKKAAEEQARKQMQDDDRYRSKLIPMITEEDIARHRAKKAAEEQARKQMQDDDRYRSKLIPMITEEDIARHRAKKAAEEQARRHMQDDDRYRSKLIPMITEEDMAKYRARQAALKQTNHSSTKQSEPEDESKYRSQLIPHITDEDIARHNAKKAQEQASKLKELKDKSNKGGGGINYTIHPEAIYTSRMIPIVNRNELSGSTSTTSTVENKGEDTKMKEDTEMKEDSEMKEDTEMKE